MTNVVLRRKKPEERETLCNRRVINICTQLDKDVARVVKMTMFGIVSWS